MDEEKQQGQIGLEIDALTKGIDVLKQEVGKLMTRLQPILRKPTGNRGVIEETKELVELVPIATAIKKCTQDIAHLYSDIDHLRLRIEI